MTMHLAPAYLNTTGSTKKKPTAKQVKAQAEHQAWLKKMGVHPDQLAQKAKPLSKKLQGSFIKDANPLPCSNTIVAAGSKKSIFDSKWKNTYDDPVMAEREAVALAKAEAKKARILPLYNKGGLQLASENEDLTKVGSLSKRL